MKDIRFIVRVKNNRLLKAREKMGFTQTAMAEYCGVGISRYGDIENLKFFPITKDGDWNIDAQKISSAVGLTEEELFPAAFKQILKTRMEYEVGLEELPKFTQPLEIEGPESLLEGQDLRKRVSAVLDSLTPREKKVLEMRFGLNGEDECNQVEVSKYFYYTKERIRQIEQKAIRKIRTTKRIRILDGRETDYELEEERDEFKADMIAREEERAREEAARPKPKPPQEICYQVAIFEGDEEPYIGKWLTRRWVKHGFYGSSGVTNAMGVYETLEAARATVPTDLRTRVDKNHPDAPWLVRDGGATEIWIC